MKPSGAGGGSRTRTGKALAILSRLCLPFHHARSQMWLAKRPPLIKRNLGSRAGVGAG